MTKDEEILRIIVKEMEKEPLRAKDIAEKIGCTKRTVNYWKSGLRTTITLDMADKALKALGLTVTLGKED